MSLRGTAGVRVTGGLFLALGWFSPAAAQNASGVATTIASVTVDTPPFTGSGVRGLDFGTLLPGVTSDIPPGPTTPSAHWQFLNVKKNRNVQASFVLPTVLALGSATIPINWNNAGYATLCLLDDNGVCVDQFFFNPAANGGVYTFSTPKKSGGPSYEVDVYLGAKATATAGLPPGTYTALVTLTLTRLN